MKDSRPNPLLEASPLPYGAPAFDVIETEDYLPAFREAVARGQAEIRRITDNPEAPSFTNTIEALELAGGDVRSAQGVGRLEARRTAEAFARMELRRRR